ncbi:ABC transporter transmembrane domain-containing protein [Janibacter sp. G56]|uniref:ABC transporter transmembrane domain-containing protein n=1 Tax=Janibacter sp. G56 TaxID=3418717 RepID=UPI003D08E6EB
MTTFPLADPGAPDTRSPGRFLLWVAGRQKGTLLAGAVAGIVWMTALALLPAALGRGIDAGLVDGDRGALVRWTLAVVGLAVVAGTMGAVRHRFAVHNWLSATFRTAQIVDRAVIDRGAAVTRTIPAGDVVAIVANDVTRLGSLYDMTARAAGAAVSYAVVAAFLLTADLRTGLVVLIGGPLLLLTLAGLVRPLHRRQTEQREQAGRLTTLGTDTVQGLRVLRGIGGEDTFLTRYERQSQDVRAAGVRVAGVQAALDSAQVLLPGLFAVIVVWIGARSVVAGDLSAGELVSFYGYATFLTMPLRTVTEAVDKYIRARIAAVKILRVLHVEPDHLLLPTGPTTSNASRGLVDPTSGLALAPGRLHAVVSARPEDSAALLERLGRVGVDPAQPALLDGRALPSIPLADLRARVVVSEADPRLFTGVLRTELTRGSDLPDERLLEALDVTSSADVLDALPDGLDSRVEERGRSFSGGQRQRLALARALLTDADVLLLIEPTSAVDAHTEARIADRLAEHRRGRTTVVATASPLLLDTADEVHLLVDGRLAATGTHHQLLRDEPAYRAIVVRGEAD